MKEEGIRKLKNILNEYEYFKELKEVPEEEKDLFVQKFFWCESYGVLNSYGCEDYEILKRKFCYMYAISKEYGFIQRLVKENKIDFQKFREKAKFLILSNSIKNYEILIMELSIQKKPVQFLIDILA